MGVSICSTCILCIYSITVHVQILVHVHAGIAPEQNPNRVLNDIHEYLIRLEP